MSSLSVIVLLWLGASHAFALPNTAPAPGKPPLVGDLALGNYAHSPPLDRSKLEPSDHWVKSATSSLRRKLSEDVLRAKAKNVIMFLGDGMSVSTVTASRIYKGQTEGLSFGEEAQLHMDSFPYAGTSKTYCADYQTADSACSSTAYLCGSKANVKTIGVSPAVLVDDCTGQMNEANQVSSILAWAQTAGMSTGIVTTTTVTHASPAGAYAHIANRDWENDRKVQGSNQNSDQCDDIAEQLVLREPGRSINVILGGGRTHFVHEGVRDPETNVAGTRNDSKNLIQDWIDDKAKSKKAPAEYVMTRDQLLAVNTTRTKFLLGLFSESHVTYADEQPANNDPSLAEMTRVAVDILSKNPKGFFLFVEGGRIDHAHHDNLGRRALAETLQFDEAIAVADRATSDKDTLILVTADHSHAFTMTGYSWRGNSILGFANSVADSETSDRLPYTTISYVNGNFGVKPQQVLGGRCVRADPSKDSIFGLTYYYTAHVPMQNRANHAGEDVLILAKGPWAHLFSGINEQSFIPHAMGFAACINPNGLNSCDGHFNRNKASFRAAANPLIFGGVVVLLAMDVLCMWRT